ncbi:release factor glutamine methyltransferase [Amycolatopsis marina]|uniref:Release factor glutamine methyltransferase n=1 Tax=Amycolatopsis marina TaxID=490629 RepID=A0A1I0X037_9PSEU|nr:HemK2/MTQ2 family protein methyltransferase [Amycolatopsis marina]SFA94027.1 release factor glutamine methyltransferase [Amycolatopsis marina]
MWLLRLPGVYRPQADTWLLTRALREAHVGPGAHVLDLCTGTGAVAVSAARLGARRVSAVDTSRRAVWSARCNARLRGLPVRAQRRDVLAKPALGGFDVVLANPPYVPRRPGGGSGSRSARAWDAGPDGRRFVDLLCGAAPALLAKGGTMLMVHSSLCGVDGTLRSLRDAALKASVVARSVEPFGPVLTERIDYLQEAGLIEPGQRHEELVVIRADRTERPR